MVYELNLEVISMVLHLLYLFNSYFVMNHFLSDSSDCDLQEAEMEGASGRAGVSTNTGGPSKG